MMIRRSSRVRKAPVLLDLTPEPVKKRRKVIIGTGNTSSPDLSSGWKLRLRNSGGKRKLFDEEEIEGNVGESEGGKLCKGKKNEGSSGDDDGSDGKEEREIMDGVELSEEESGSRELETLDECDTVTDGVQLDEERSGSRELEIVDQVEGEKEGGDCTVSGEEVASVGKDTCLSDICGEQLKDVDVKVDKMKRLSGDMLEQRQIRQGRRCGLCGRGTDGKPPKKLVRDHTDSDNETYGGSSSCEEGNYDSLDGFGEEPGWLGRLLGPIHDRFGIADVWVHQHCAVWSPEVGIIDFADFIIKLHVSGLLDGSCGCMGIFYTVVVNLPVARGTTFAFGCRHILFLYDDYVYFAGLGRLKNVRAALLRGRALKCSRCGRPGATIGCRVDRCPKTYHLVAPKFPFIIVGLNCSWPLFQPHGNDNLQRLKRLKAKKVKLETRKLFHDAWRKDFEAEEKWLENCGEDEEFLKREGKRLHRDILRIAPVYIGGPSSENEKLYQGWESVAGLQDVIQCMKEVVLLPLLYPELFATIGLTPPRGVLLHGYPGTGKTHVVRALIGSCARGDRRIAYFARKGADCLGKYVGDAERQLRLLFQVAERSQPSIIFFDEIDGLAPCRTRKQDQTHNSVVSTLLALMDGLKSRGSVVVIGATNRPDAVDSALRRPGRFDREIYFPLPSVKDRAAILSLHTRSWTKPISGSLLKWVAHRTAGFAGADLQALCSQAAMIALKRTCPLQKLMSAAEKEANCSRRLPLPSCTVEERDWLDALACAPPPCSRREAGMAANDVVASPLRAHLVPCLLQPLSYLLVSLFLDERVWLPPFLYKAAKLIKNVIISALDQREKSTELWWAYLPELVKEADVERQIERSLSCTGFVIAGSSFTSYNLLTDDYDGSNEFEPRVSHAGGRIGLLQNVSSSDRNLGFRVLVTGRLKSGQQHLASTLLHGFMGCVEIQKVDLATISQEGHGDLVEGMTSILCGKPPWCFCCEKLPMLKCSSMGLCLIYMPRIDLWAMETQHQADVREDDSCENLSKSADTAGSFDANRTASQIWNCFMEQVEAMRLSAPLMILATSGVPSEDLPHRIYQFFTSNALNLNGSTISEHTMPRFIVQVAGSFDLDMVINSSATQLSRDLVQQYVQLLHHEIHTTVSEKKYNAGDPVSIAEFESDITLSGPASVGINNLISSRIFSNGVGSCNGNKTTHVHGDDQFSTMSENTNSKGSEVRLFHPQDTVSRVHCTSGTVKAKSNVMLAVSSFGYQILRYPHFAELCWTTSKLKEGPCADINGPWKGWPFNSCIVRPHNSLEKLCVGQSPNGLKNKEIFCVVRGLIAVGLLAYRGIYTSTREVSSDVRKVLELLVTQINAKILAGKERYLFIHLLSQVAYLEDMVNSWEYTLRSLERDNSPSLTNLGARIVGIPDDRCGSECNLVASGVCKPTIFQKNSDEVKVLEHSELIGCNEGITCLDLPYTKARITTSEEPLQEISPLVQPSHGQLLQTPTSAEDLLPPEHILDMRNNVTNAEHENNKSVEVLYEGFVASKKSNGLAVEGSLLGVVCSHDELRVVNSSSGKVGNDCKGLSGAKVVLVSSDSTHKRDGCGENVSIDLNKHEAVSSVSRLTCSYGCCFNCIDLIYGLVRKILIRESKIIGSSLTVEDVHDVVSSWSTNLLSAFRKFYVVESVRKSELISKSLRHENNRAYCACSNVDHFQQKGTSCDQKSENGGLILEECSLHSKSHDSREHTDACTNSQVALGLKCFFKDNVLISSILDKDVLFHCKCENLCLGSLIEWILMTEPPLDSCDIVSFD
ncbi:hypothetical protein IFM89_014387 [Coptis chinensis]|uniref:AAA+ ATPase domain-containing protein n=1 Tax=Coptis chinensis TaxID=261450 RepID=A0A835GXG9_9MAGN|nr:hypothetical protein IFM89_014387 [Coptis chinensis]